MDKATLPASSASAHNTVRLRPKRSIAAAANGPIRPNSARLIDKASEMAERLQPNSRSSGTIITLGAARMAAVVNITRKVTATAIQP